jgi:hypothetical protein
MTPRLSVEKLDEAGLEEGWRRPVASGEGSPLADRWDEGSTGLGV